MKTLRKSRRSTTNALALAAGLLAGTLLIPSPVLAQAASASGAANDKIQYYTDAITAEQSGDLAKAKDLLGKIIAMDPSDPGNREVQAHIALLDRAMADQAGGKTSMLASNGAPSAAALTPVVVSQLPADASSSTAASTAPAVAAVPAKPAPSAEAEAALKIQAQKQQNQIADVRKAISDARALEAAGQYDDARAKLTAAQQQLPAGLGSMYVAQEISQEITNSWYNQAQDAYKSMSYSTAKDLVASYSKAGGDPKRAQSLLDSIARAQANPMRQDPNVVAPGFEQKQDMIKQLLVRGQAEYIYGDYTDALQTFDQVITNDPNNITAQAYEKKINEVLFNSSDISHDSTRAQFLKEVNDAWRMPSVYTGSQGGGKSDNKVTPEMKKLAEIIIPVVDIDIPTPLDEIVGTLTLLSRKYDKEGKGLNFHVSPPNNGQAMPKVKLAKLNDISLQRLLDIACRDAGYGYYDDSGIIALSQGSSSSMSQNGQFETKSFPMTEGTRTRLLGFSSGSSDSSSSSAPSTPFSDSSSGGSSSSASSSSDASSQPAASDIEQRLTDFFQRAGIDFPPGARIAYTPGNIYVTNTPKNLETLGNFLKQYSSVKQAEIEARFLDVSEGDLQQFGANWNVSNPAKTGQASNFLRSSDLAGNTTLRSLGGAFPLGNNGAQPTVVTGLSATTTTIVNEPGINPLTLLPESVPTPVTSSIPLQNLSIPQSIPTLPNEINVGGATTDLFNGVVSWLQGYRINMILDALSQKQGSDLMSAPKIVVMTEHDANITIAQQLLYPQTFSPIQSQVSPAGNNTGGGSGGVTITAGTPNGFVTANIGVTMEVVPKIYDDDTIELHLNPIVTEFEGFIEYGGTSLAIQSGTTASVPSGFIQPIFDVRQITTDVTIFDGATVVLGGLTRDEVKTVDDKIPILGDIPLVGRLFQSKGESSQKRNLMIFVTANIISPGGAPANQSIANITPGSVFQNPTIVTPNRAIPRVPENALGTPAVAAP